jgi:2-amino-4-hydroxy-6-hydroxymethyldihydropteridine diphosphokinase
MTCAYLSIGSNIAPVQNIRKCIICLRQEFGHLDFSSIYQCAAVGFEGKDFLNLVIGLETELEPKNLSDRLKALEEQLGRRHDVAKFSDRCIDIDLLLHGLNDGDFDGLKLPRDEILKYPFVLLPLAELAPDLMHPVVKRSLQDLWREMALSGHDLVVIDPSRSDSILD